MKNELFIFKRVKIFSFKSFRNPRRFRVCITTQYTWKIKSNHFLLWPHYFNEVSELHCPKKTWIYLTSCVHMYWMNFRHLTVHVQQNIFDKTLIKVDSSHFCASFGTFCVQICKLFESQWDLQLSFENSDFTVFKHFSKTHSASKNKPIWKQNMPKEA